jgi:hypothetical protein
MSGSLPSEWTTHREVEFLRNLGSHTPPALRDPDMTRRILLTRYLESIDKREDWEAVDVSTVKRAAELMLEGYQG